jgi:hypothetical protein
MENINKVHCFFEQSGTFKNEFIKLGIPAEDYDIQNNFGETDHVVDLFKAIEDAYNNKSSLFDNIEGEDLIIAFFPCIYFSSNNTLHFDGSWLTYHQRGMTELEINEAILERGRQRQYFYEILLKLFSVCTMKGLRLIVENPYATHHYLHANFPYKPKLIDYDRRMRGDYFKKPTQYFFHNCEPTFGQSYTKPKEVKNVKQLSGGKGGLCNEERSLISPDYTRNFICDFILGKVQKHSQPTLF